jgi:hypothetical protein
MIGLAPQRQELDYRFHRSLLDRCLDAVEGAIARGEQSLSPNLINSLRTYVPTLEAGMPLPQVLDRVFEAQEQLRAKAGLATSASMGTVRSTAQRRSSRLTLPAPADQPATLGTAEAQDLTLRIKGSLGEVPLLMNEAHERRAWVALGYRTWEQYVRIEFRMSRSRSYELLDQARIILAVRGVVGCEWTPPISALAATQIKPHLHELLEELRNRVSVEGIVPNASREQVVSDAIERIRTRASRASSSMAEEHSTAPPSTSAVIAALKCLASQPHPEQLLADASHSELTNLAAVAAAAGNWLADLQGALLGVQFNHPRGGANLSGIPYTASSGGRKRSTTN